MSRCYILSAIIACSWIVGCNGDSNPTTYPVSGTVTLDGKAVDGAAVTFFSTDPNLRPATGTTDKEGKYVLGSFKSGDGAMPGQYKIMVTKFWSDAGPSPYDAPADAPVETPEPTKLTDAEQRAAYEKAYKTAPKGPPAGAAKQPKSGNHLPKQYENADTSGLTFTVANGPNTYDIQLKSK